MAKLTFFGGIEGTIGGNMILLEDPRNDASVLLDFGVNYDKWSQYFDFPFSRPVDINDLIRCGVVPNIHGLYAGDESQSLVNACIISHPHNDHYKYASILKEGTSIHMSKCGYEIVKAVEEVKESKSFEDKLVERADKNEIAITNFRTGDKIKINNLEIEPVHVDHSVPGAYGFLIHTSSGLIVYTGDLRKHGLHSELTDDFINAIQSAGERVKILICEGTHLIDSTNMTEKDVLNKSTEVAEKTDGLFIVDHSQADIDRIGTIFKVAESAKKTLVVSEKIANILQALSSDARLGKGIREIIGKSSVYFGSQKKWATKKRKTKLDKKIEAAFGDKQIFSEEIHNSPSKYILATNIYGFSDLKALQPPAGSIYLLSASEPFKEEREFEFERLLRWLDMYGLPLVRIHASGHITPNDLREFVKSLKPETLIPVHTEHPNLMKLYLSDQCGKTMIPEKNVPIEVA